MLTHPDDSVVGHHIRISRTWEPGEGRFLRSVLRPGMNAIDVGANIGYFTLLMARAVSPGGRVLAIEAEPETFQLLRANVALNALDNVELLPVAAHRMAGLISITRDPRNHGASSAARVWTGWTTTPVQAVRIDDVLDPEMSVDLVKIDIEGMDHVAVEGLERTIARWRPTIVLEFNPGWIEVMSEQPRDVLRYYRSLGYEIRLLGADALRLYREAGMALDDLLLDNLVVSPGIESELIDAARRIYYINFILR